MQKLLSFNQLAIFFIIMFLGISGASFAQDADQVRVSEIDKMYETLTKTVVEGDYEGYGNLYHKDAVVVFTSGDSKTTVPISNQLKAWKQGFVDTRNGKMKADVKFKFSLRIGDDTTAFETGIFNYNVYNADGSVQSAYYGHFNMLLVKVDGEWKMLMEHQKADGTEAEWDAMD